MRRLLLAALIVLFPSLAIGWGGPAMLGGAVPSAGDTACTLVLDQSTNNGAMNVSTLDNTQYTAEQFTAGDWAPITKIQLHLRGYGDPDAITYTIKIQADSGGVPGADVASCTLSGTAVTVGSSAFVGCTFAAGVQLTNTALYHATIDRGGTLDATNYVAIRYYGTGTLDMQQDANGTGTWDSMVDSNGAAVIQLFTGTLCSGN